MRSITAFGDIINPNKGCILYTQDQLKERACINQSKGTAPQLNSIVLGFRHLATSFRSHVSGTDPSLFSMQNGLIMSLSSWVTMWQWNTNVPDTSW
mmetsp:Transcript_879/g.1757  ORF Transcript_879/g.1757 Transcript_879/m.1757 type:complete len:96 (-) Transcript_879:82-369(-)